MVEGRGQTTFIVFTHESHGSSGDVLFALSNTPSSMALFLFLLTMEEGKFSMGSPPL